MEDFEYIKGSGNLTKQEIIALREKYINDYAHKKGWNADALSQKQYIEITESKGYKYPGLLLS